MGAALPLCVAQDLVPRAYVITPAGLNAIVVSWAYNSGEVLLDPTVPIKDLQAGFHVPVLSYYHSFRFLSRSANLAIGAPYAFGRFHGQVAGSDAGVTRSGLADARFRLSVNLHGGPAMKLAEFAKYRERTIVGASLTVVMPTGQYDPVRAINIGTNRWGFKPEMAVARRFGKWAVDAYGGAWIFTTNSQYYPGATVREQNTIGSLEFHLGYYFRRTLWASADSNFWWGGSTVQNGVRNDDGARNSRVGGTLAIPFTRHQSFKFNISRGAVVRVGGNFTSVSLGWQYSWFNTPM
jgi:hypothetical protein